MIILDTNVVSHMMKPRGGGYIDHWIDGQIIENLAITSITFEEIAFGLHIMPLGKRKAALAHAFHHIYGQIRCLPFRDVDAAQCAVFRSTRQTMGREVKLADSQIAGIVASYDATLATRNIRDFDGVTLKLINPWNVP